MSSCRGAVRENYEMSARSHKQASASLMVLALTALLAGCADAKTVYVDDYQELRPYTTTVLSDTQPVPSSQPNADQRARASATGG